MRNGEPEPVAPDEHALEPVDRARLREPTGDARWAAPRGRARGRPRSDSRPDARGEPPRVVVGHLVGGHVGPHVQRRQIATSRAVLRGSSAAHAPPARSRAATTTAGAGAVSRRRSAGAATPAATSAHAVARMALDTRKRASIGSARPAPPARRSDPAPCQLECRAVRLARHRRPAQPRPPPLRRRLPSWPSRSCGLPAWCSRRARWPTSSP